MTIYVDALVAWEGDADNPTANRFFGHGKESCHMTTDGPVGELHRFATGPKPKKNAEPPPGGWGLGLKISYYQSRKNPKLSHYDLTPKLRELALKLGAVEGSAYSGPTSEHNAIVAARAAELGQQLTEAIHTSVLPNVVLPSVGEAVPTLWGAQLPSGGVAVKRANPMIRVWGAGPAGTTCDECVFLQHQQPYHYIFLKCEKRGMTHKGEHLKKWQTCGRFVAKEGGKA